MNILPKKRWHVRTKENIARVRRDEAEANAKERERQEKLEFAESEARINFLRKKSGIPERQKSEIDAASSSNTKAEPSEHVDLFADYKTHIKTTNKDLEKEKKDEQEKYEKQIGYLTYLGQDTNEALKLRSWYEVLPKRATVGDAINEKDVKIKHAHDPLTLINTLLPPDKKPPERKRRRSTTPPPAIEQTQSTELPQSSAVKRSKTDEKSSRSAKRHKKDKKHKKGTHHKKGKSSKKDKRRQREDKRVREIQEQQAKRDKLEKLRKERLRREASERARQEALLAPKESDKTESESVAPISRIVQKYNSQFNPELAKQNMV